MHFPGCFGFEITLAKLENNRLSGTDIIPAELVLAGGETLWSVIHQLINFLWNNGELHAQWKESAILLIYEEDDETDCNNYSVINFMQNYIQYPLKVEHEKP